MQVDTTNVDWRIFMFRTKEQQQWTQAYDGLTRNAKAERAFVRVFGPEQDMVTKFYAEGK